MESIVQSLAGIVVAGVLAQWIAWRAGLPSILLLLAVGILAGPVLGWLDPDALFGDLLLPLVSLSVAVILYEGGLSLRLGELRHVGTMVRNLCTIGVVVTWAGGTLFARWCFDVPWNMALLLGALFIVTGPTVIGPMLRQIRPHRSVGTALKWEGIVTDPLGVMVTILVFEVILHGLEGANPVRGVAFTLGMGSLYGVLAGLGMGFLLRRHLLPDHLQNPVSLMLVFVVFGASEQLQPESGLLAVTVMGVTLANQRRVDIRHIVEFKESLQVLLLAVLFVLLAARIDREMLLEISWRHVLFLGALVVVVRPVSVLLSGLGTPMAWRERFFVALVAPRGIVSAALASVIALEFAEHDVADAAMIVPLAFFVIVGTVLVYGTGAPFVARWLGVSSAAHKGLLILGAHEWARALAETLQRVGGDVLLVDTNRNHVGAARMTGLEAVGENILTEGALEDIDLSDRGVFLALTPNDEVNSLACVRLAEVFGRANVYQLETADATEGEDELEVGGRRLFDEDVTYRSITRRHREGWVFKSTRLSQDFTIDDYHELYGADALPLFVVSEDESIVPFDSKLPLQAREGQKLVGLVPGDADPPGRARRRDEAPTDEG
ncbi:MAG TPA: cation:proton antiporter [Candidatus Krumholzibacteria bacterium]|nr:cation:proton antiporter [Candidatus Krumholzibacteria bacterium]